MTELPDVGTPARDGAEVLDTVEATIRRYCILPSPHAVHAVVLWIAYTHMVDAFDYAPRVVVKSPQKRCGKTRLLEVVGRLVHAAEETVNATTAYVFRSLDREPPPTLLFDEADTIFGSKKVAEQNEDLRGLLNAGFKRGATVGRIVGPTHEPKRFTTFAPALIAGIGDAPDTIEDRAVIITMRRRKPSEKVEPYRDRKNGPALDALNDALSEWATSVLDSATGYEPEDMGVEDRAADVWEPLVTVADMAGGRWPKLAREAARAMTSEAAEVDAKRTTNGQLLADIKSVFDDDGRPFIPSQELVAELRKFEESPWAQFDLTPSKLGHRLREYEITTKRNTAGTARGYRLEDFTDSWDRYLAPPSPSEAVRSRPQASDQPQRSDTFRTSDAFKVSDEIKASNDNRRSEPDLTPLTPSDGGTGRSGAKPVSDAPSLAPVDTGRRTLRDDVLGSLSHEHALDARTVSGSCPGFTLEQVRQELDLLAAEGAVLEHGGKYTRWRAA